MRMRMMEPQPKQKPRFQWMIVLVDVWFLFGFILGYYTQNAVIFTGICVVAVLLIITHFILSLR